MKVRTYYPECFEEMDYFGGYKCKACKFEGDCMDAIYKREFRGILC